MFRVWAALVNVWGFVEPISSLKYLDYAVKAGVMGLEINGIPGICLVISANVYELVLVICALWVLVYGRTVIFNAFTEFTAKNISSHSKLSPRRTQEVGLCTGLGGCGSSFVITASEFLLHL